MESIAQLNGIVNSLVWGVPAIVCILGVGIWLTIGSGGVQFRRFWYATTHTIGRIFDKKDAGDGSVTPFQALSTALSGTVGTGNIAGVAGAIALGGPGAIFWMWVSAILGMCTKFAEVVLAVHFRERNAKGDWVGGPMYYIKNGLGKQWRFLAVLYAFFGACAVFGTGNATQINTIVSSLDSALISFGVAEAGGGGLKFFNLLVGIACAVGLGLVLIGGIKRIGRVTEKLVPFMALLYIILALGVLAMNLDKIGPAFGMIFEAAFNPKAVTGGAVGSLFIAMRRGLSRGIFSNEAGIGTGSIAHAASDVGHPIHQGLFGIFEVFVDTIVICTLTALVILCGAPEIIYGKAAGADLTISGFTNTYGPWVSLFTAVAIICFAFSTAIGWGLYGTRCMEYLFGMKIAIPFLVAYALTAIIGATMDLGLMWEIADTFNGLMLIPNVIALFLLSGTFFGIVKRYFTAVDAGQEPEDE